MTPGVLLSLVSPADLGALALLVAAWAWIGWRIERPGRRRLSVTLLMARYRREWMAEFVTREPRIFDAQMLGNLRQGTAFFASTALIAIGGILALIGNPAPLESVAEGIAGEQPALLWQVRLLPATLLLSHAFLRFVWSNRLFGYCAVVMSAVPNDPAHPLARHRADQAADLNIRAAWNFNRGLRSMYFALGSFAWLIAWWALAAATVAILWILWSREYASVPHEILSRKDPS